DLSFLHRLRQTIVVQQLGVAIVANEEVAAEAGTETERIDPEVGQIRQVNRVGQTHVIAVRRRVELLPKPLPAGVTSCRRKHVVLSQKLTIKARKHREEPQGKG